MVAERLINIRRSWGNRSNDTQGACHKALMQQASVRASITLSKQWLLDGRRSFRELCTFVRCLAARWVRWRVNDALFGWLMVADAPREGLTILLVHATRCRWLKRAVLANMSHYHGSRVRTRPLVKQFNACKLSSDCNAEAGLYSRVSLVAADTI